MRRCLPPGVGAVALFNLAGLDLSVFPEFYKEILYAWLSLGGQGDVRDRSYTIHRSSKDVSQMSVKNNYLFLLESSFREPHCVEKWRPRYGELYWDSTWSQFWLSCFHRSAVDLSWKIEHGVLFTFDRLRSFGYSGFKDCYCGQSGKSLEHLFFSCPLAQSILDWISVLFFTAVPDCPALREHHILFDFSKVELALVPRLFPVILILFKWSVWLARNDFHFRDHRPCVEDVLASL